MPPLKQVIWASCRVCGSGGSATRTAAAWACSSRHALGGPRRDRRARPPAPACAEGFLTAIDAEPRTHAQEREGDRESATSGDGHVAWSRGSPMPTSSPRPQLQRHDPPRPPGSARSRSGASTWTTGDVGFEDDCVWTLRSICRASSARIVVDAQDIWSLAANQVTIEGSASRTRRTCPSREPGTRLAFIFPGAEGVLDDSEPASLSQHPTGLRVPPGDQIILQE